MKRSFGILALSAIAAVCGGFFLSAAQGQIRDDGVDPSTPLGRSVIQNEQYQQQEQQNEQQSRQNQEEQQQRDQTFRQQQNYYGSGGGGGGGGGGGEMPSGPFGAIYVGAGVKPVIRYSYNYPTLATAKAAARQACQAKSRVACREALVMRSTCGAIAVATNGMWAARAASLDVQAGDEAMTACHASSKRDCDLKAMYCTPNNN